MINPDDRDHAIKSSGFQTEHAVGAVVIAALVILILLRRGFRGVSIPGVGSVGLK